MSQAKDGLGNNRDYKTNARRVTSNLARHQELYTELLGFGLQRDEADVLAYKLVMESKRPSTAEFAANLETKYPKLKGSLSRAEDSVAGTGILALLTLLAYYALRRPDKPVDYDLTTYQPEPRSW